MVRPFLVQAMDPPESVAVEHAVQHLESIGALDSMEELTPLGEHLASLPVDPALGKLLLMGAIFNCLEPVLSIAASLSCRSPFVMPLEKCKESDDAKLHFAGDHCSDQWALLQAVSEYQKLKEQGKFSEIRDWCSRSFLMQNTLEMICDLRMQLAQVYQAAFLRAAALLAVLVFPVLRY
jgi:ATP-dependent RNA helicase DHX36